MADSAITSRLWNLWTGFLSLWVRDIEKEHPEIAYQNSIQAMIEKYTKLRAASGAIIARRLDVEGRLSQAKADLASVANQLSAALATNQDDLAVVLIEKKNGLTEAIAGLEADAAGAKTDSDETKGALLTIQSQINELKAEKDRMLAKFHSAEARLKIQGQLDGLSVDAEVQALAGVRDHIKARVAEAQLGAELQGSDLNTRLSTLQRTAGSITARAELEQMKQARAATAAGAAGGKTL